MLTVQRSVPVATLANGHVLNLHVHEAAGAAGPTLALIGGVMGDQPLGSETIRRVLAALDPGALRGRILALPVANPYAYHMASRTTPIDSTNLNRVFPGDANGTFTEQLAEVIWREVAARCDAMIAFHSGGAFETVDYTYVFDDLPLARAFGTPLLLPGPTYPGSLAHVAHERGIRMVVGELGGGQQRTEWYVERGVRGAQNVMRHLGMLEGTPDVPERQILAEERVVLRPHHGGVLLSAVDATSLGHTVAGGSELGMVVNPHTFEIMERFVAPYEASILALVRERVVPVEVGQYAYIVANGATARPV